MAVGRTYRGGGEVCGKEREEPDATLSLPGRLSLPGVFAWKEHQSLPAVRIDESARLWRRAAVIPKEAGALGGGD